MAKAEDREKDATFDERCKVKRERGVTKRGDIRELVRDQTIELGNCSRTWRSGLSIFVTIPTPGHNK